MNNAIQSIRQLSAQDALILITEQGIPNSLEIIEFLSPQQAQQIFDLDIWNDAQIDSNKVEAWLEAMLEANPERAAQVFHELDPELLSYLIKTHTQVFELDDGQEPDGLSEERLRTPDNQYVITFTQSIWRQLFEQFLSRDLEFALQLIQSVRYETASSLEEEALYFREGRLQDLGFLPLAENKAILAYVNPDADFTINPSLVENEGLGIASSMTLLHYIKPGGLFQNTLQRLPEGIQERVLQEFISTCNRVHMAFKRNPGEIQALQETVSYVILMVEKALEYRNPKILGQIHLSRLFQIGRTLSNR